MTFTIPNLLSLLRMGLIPLFVILVMNGSSGKALLLFIVAGVTDALDGFIARFWKQQSLLGAYLDPIADKLLLTTAYVVLSIPSLNHGTQIPAWITILVIARDVLIVVVALVLYLAAGIRKFPPSVLSKINTILQVVAVVLVLVSGVFRDLRWIELVADTALYLVAGLTVASGLYYIYLYSHKKVREELRSTPPE
ncbi:MAG TPA: CDP-alcohol phosphatidyltransferase family protein [Thermoanaerobaculia bacterium]|nr:CDP-alcohol phosphatidyltransferase family protein [Thermoanaerobaculia bacterium]